MSLKARVRRLERAGRNLWRRVLVILPGGEQRDGTTGKPWPGGPADVRLSFDFQPMTPEEIEEARRQTAQGAR